MSHQNQIQVLIIGAGVVGLSASLFLAHHGIASAVVERHSGTSIHPRARSVNARTMEFFRHIGIDERVKEAGKSIAASAGMLQGHTLREIVEARPRKEAGRHMPLAGLVDSLSPANGTFVTQDLLEPVLLESAKERGVDVRYFTECTDVQQDDEGVTATLKDRESVTIFEMRASYMIAADGAKSPIRNRLNTPTTGRGALGYLLNILFAADLRELVRDREFSIACIRQPLVTGFMTSINNSDRWVFHLSYDPSKGETPANFPPERCEALLQEAIGIPGLAIEIKSILPWEPTVRVVEQMQHERIFLAGDSAHQMPPYAGQGATSGIADVWNLAWKLAFVLNGHAGPALLRTYDAERLDVDRHAAEVSALGVDDKGLMSLEKNVSFVTGRARKALIVAGFGYGYNSSAICAESTFPLGGLTWKPWTFPSLVFAIDGRPGRRAPHVWVERHGTRISTLNLLGKSFVLLAGAEGQRWLDAARSVAESLNVALEAYCVGPGCALRANAGVFEAAAGVSSKGAILVRPDDYVVWRERRTSSDAVGILSTAMKSSLCLT